MCPAERGNVADLVLLRRPADGVAVVTLNRPAKYNALSADLLAELRGRLAELAGDAGLRALVLTGADPAFCAGLDLVELGAGTEFSPGALAPLLALGVPVIGAINGVAVTGGLELALACDFRIGSERARFADTHARIGVTPAWGLTARLPQAVGQAWARQMSMTGDFVDAPTALRIGLINELVAHDALLDRSVQLATSVTSTDKATAARIRELYDLTRDQGGGQALAAELAPASTVVVRDAEEFAARRAAVFARGRAQRP
jgi:enoyl-CoA hydratase